MQSSEVHHFIDLRRILGRRPEHTCKNSDACTSPRSRDLKIQAAFHNNATPFGARSQGPKKFPQNFTNYKLIKFHCTNSYMAHVLANPPVDGKMQACRYLAAILPPSCRHAAPPPARTTRCPTHRPPSVWPTPTHSHPLHSLPRTTIPHACPLARAGDDARRKGDPKMGLFRRCRWGMWGDACRAPPKARAA